MPKVDLGSVERYERQAYPGRLRARTAGCVKARLSDAVGLTKIGVGEVELAPGAATGLYHWHEQDDEFVYVLAGEVVMVEGDRETILCAGDSAGFKAGVRVGHTFENRSDKPARLLEIGQRDGAAETAHYPGLDMLYRRENGVTRMETRAGATLAKTDEVARISDDPEAVKPPSPLDID